MDATGSETIVLAFSLPAAQELKNPKDVFEGAQQWATSIGIVSEQPLVELTGFVHYHELPVDFNSGPRDKDHALDESSKLIVSDRHIFIGHSEDDEQIADEVDWEYLPIADAAAKAEWELESIEVETDGEALFDTLDVDESEYLDVQIATYHWHNINRGTKTWVVRPVDDEFNADTVVEGGNAVVRRGVGEMHKVWTEITDVRMYDEVEAILEDIPHDAIRPGTEEDEALEKMNRQLNQYDEYIAFEINVVEQDD